MPELVMSIDAGTTGVTVLIVDGSTSVVGRAYSEFSQHYPRPGWVEHDAEEIWEVTQRVAAGACCGTALRASPSLRRSCGSAEGLLRFAGG